MRSSLKDQAWLANDVVEDMAKQLACENLKVVDVEKKAVDRKTLEIAIGKQ